jgi:hypothetical protein
MAGFTHWELQWPGTSPVLAGVEQQHRQSGFPPRQRSVFVRGGSALALLLPSAQLDSPTGGRQGIGGPKLGHSGCVTVSQIVSTFQAHGATHQLSTLPWGWALLGRRTIPYGTVRIRYHFAQPAAALIKPQVKVDPSDHIRDMDR